MSEAGPYTRGHNHSPSYNSAESGGTTLGDLHGSSINLSAMTPPDSPPLPKSGISRGSTAYDTGRSGEFSANLDVNNIGKAIASRVVRTARRGNLPFLLIFLSCLVYFFAALAGIGYVDPDTLPSVPGAPIANIKAPAVFIPGVPIFDPNEDSEVVRRRKHEEMKELEMEWQKMRRPKDGAWMRKQRDDKAVRRVPVKAPEPVYVEKYEETKD